MAKSPLAFLSYVRTDDEHEDGKILTFAKRLRGQVRLFSGEDFEIFIDRDEIKWGQQWKERIASSIDAATFLIPILTPAYFRREWCRKELLQFVKHESEAKRNDLILPVHYVPCKILSDEHALANDEMVRVINERQYRDWTRVRTEPWTTPEVGRLFE